MKEVTVQELKAMMDNGSDFQLIDVREPFEAEAANIGGELIPMGEVLSNVDKIAKDKPVVVHCRSGARSATIINALQSQHGFENLHNLKGGIMAWSREIDPSITVS
jgi:adenylyltransferase/sulfurtransferase